MSRDIFAGDRYLPGPGVYYNQKYKKEFSDLYKVPFLSRNPLEDVKGITHLPIILNLTKKETYIKQMISQVSQ